MSTDRHPEWWLYALAALGWLALAAAELQPDQLHHAADAMFIRHAALALAMVAVMAPLVAANVRYAALRSPRRTRSGIAAAVTIGWASVWLLTAAAIAVASHLAVVTIGAIPSIAGATLLAVGWQWSKPKRLSLSRCHRVFAPPLSPRRARAASLRYGRDLGRNCVLSCLPFMALMSVSAHSLVVAIPLAAIAWYERRRRPHHDPAPDLSSGVVAVVGAGATTLAVVGLM